MKFHAATFASLIALSTLMGCTTQKIKSGEYQILENTFRVSEWGRNYKYSTILRVDEKPVSAYTFGSDCAVRHGSITIESGELYKTTQAFMDGANGYDQLFRKMCSLGDPVANQMMLAQTPAEKKRREERAEQSQRELMNLLLLDSMRNTGRNSSQPVIPTPTPTPSNQINCTTSRLGDTSYTNCR